MRPTCIKPNAFLLLQPIKDELLGRLASEVDWINAEELGLCTFLASENEGR